MRKMVTVHESIRIRSSKERVWNFTQNFDNRKVWDKSILAHNVIQKRPSKTIWVKMKGGIQSTLKYKLCDRLNRTSLQMVDTKSLWIKGGGGSWKYAQNGDWTTWEQTNTLELRTPLLYVLLGWFTKQMLKRNTRIGMKRAKTLIETGLHP
ncbi:MAG: SRPBCC family protein [Bacteroidia bacterium]|nr:SRPBCC family protein [Bacteroidia bacterium]